MSSGIIAAWITDGIPTATSGIPNIASLLLIRKSAAIATSRPPPSVYPDSRVMTGVGKSCTAAQRFAAAR